MLKNIITNFTLEHILWVFRKKLFYILLITLLCACAAGYLAQRTMRHTYVAEVSFYVYSNPNFVNDATVNISGADFSEARTLVDSYMQVLKSRSFLEKVAAGAGVSHPVEELREAISSAAVSNTAVFTVSVFDDVPQNAMNIANTIGELAPDEITRVVKAGGIEVIDYAVLPSKPYASTSVVKYILVGGLGGFCLSLALFMLHGLSRTLVCRKSDVTRLFNIPILGEVPLMTAPGRKAKVNKILSVDSPFAQQEAYNGIAMNLVFTGKGEACPVYALTSAIPAEGKSLTGINLAVAYAKMDKKVLLIDADMRKGALSEQLELSGQHGLSEYLAGIDNQPNITESHGVSVIPSGTLPPNPGELLMGRWCTTLLQSCRAVFDVIFIDLPPVGVVTDALSLVDKVTAYLLVIRENVSKTDLEERAILKLEQMNAEICGFVYNGVDIKGSAYYRKYMRGYAAETGATKP